MNRLVLKCAAACALLLSACGGGEVVVQAFVTDESGQPTALANLPVRALPYDRDVIFDSLAAAYGTPEPAIPADLLALRDSIARAQEEWRNAESRWIVGRDSLQRLNARLANLNRASGEYVVLFREANALHDQVDAAQRQMNQAFQRFQSLNTGYASRANETRLLREQWGDAAYADFNDVIAARLRNLRRAEVADTTDANGVARLQGLQSGQWWIQARYDLLFEELYWNIPVQVNGEQVQVQLTRENAQVRPKL